jgi:hypothetical protein
VGFDENETKIIFGGGRGGASTFISYNHSVIIFVIDL